MASDEYALSLLCSLYTTYTRERRESAYQALAGARVARPRTGPHGSATLRLGLSPGVAGNAEPGLRAPNSPQYGYIWPTRAHSTQTPGGSTAGVRMVFCIYKAGRITNDKPLILTHSPTRHRPSELLLYEAPDASYCSRSLFAMNWHIRNAAAFYTRRHK